MSTILITGGTGLIGKALCKALLEKGHQLIVFTRGPRTSQTPDLRYVEWNPAKGKIDVQSVVQADHIIHLAGAGVAEKRWTRSRKREILDSRVDSGKLLVKTLLENKHRVRSFASASAIGWYGKDPSVPNPRPFEERDPAAPDFLGQACVEWEKSVAPLADTDIRLTIFRTGIVLSMEGGALKEFAKPLKAGMATILGSGRQVISWIHIDDMVRLYVNTVENDSLNGIYNAVAPKPVSNKELVLQLAKAVRKNAYIPVHVPRIALEIAMGEMSTEVLKSTTVSCTRLHIDGFTFVYPTIEAALLALVAKGIEPGNAA